MSLRCSKSPFGSFTTQLSAELSVPQSAGPSPSQRFPGATASQGIRSSYECSSGGQSVAGTSSTRRPSLQVRGGSVVVVTGTRPLRYTGSHTRTPSWSIVGQLLARTSVPHSPLDLQYSPSLTRSQGRRSCTLSGHSLGSGIFRTMPSVHTGTLSLWSLLDDATKSCIVCAVWWFQAGMPRCTGCRLPMLFHHAMVRVPSPSRTDHAPSWDLARPLKRTCGSCELGPQSQGSTHSKPSTVGSVSHDDCLHSRTCLVMSWAK
mmetsp:Transcript_32096/g.69899  ORF Transcript_32096/g.69899 Transcript_32096/m.69899 type:complete len:261 (-) Transcript_32096:201-983(-)